MVSSINLHPYTAEACKGEDTTEPQRAALLLLCECILNLDRAKDHAGDGDMTVDGLLEQVKNLMPGGAEEEDDGKDMARFRAVRAVCLIESARAKDDAASELAAARRLRRKLNTTG